MLRNAIQKSRAARLCVNCLLALTQKRVFLFRIEGPYWNWICYRHLPCLWRVLPCGKPQPGSVCDKVTSCRHVCTTCKGCGCWCPRGGPCWFLSPCKSTGPWGCVPKDVPVLSELLEKPQQFKHGSVWCLCVRVLTLGWDMITNLTIDRIWNKPVEQGVNRDRLQSLPSFVIKKPCTLHTSNKGEIFYCLETVIKMLLHPKSLPISNTPQTSVFRLVMAWALHAFALLCSRGVPEKCVLQPRFEYPMTFKWMREVSEKCLNFRLSSEPHSAPEESSHHFLNLIN